MQSTLKRNLMETFRPSKVSLTAFMEYPKGAPDTDDENSFDLSKVSEKLGKLKEVEQSFGNGMKSIQLATAFLGSASLVRLIYARKPLRFLFQIGVIGVGSYLTYSFLYINYIKSIVNEELTDTRARVNFFITQVTTSHLLIDKYDFEAEQGLQTLDNTPSHIERQDEINKKL